MPFSDADDLSTRKGRRQWFSLWVVRACVLLSFIAVVIMIGPTLRGASNTDAIKEQNEVSGCRGKYSADRELASARLDDERAHLIGLLSEGFTARWLATW